MLWIQSDPPMKDLIEQAQAQSLDFVAAWRNGSTAQKQELFRGFFPEGLPFSNEGDLMGMQIGGLRSAVDGHGKNGAGDGI